MQRGILMNGLLTVSLIVKNEERFLPACLQSIQPIADDIIVVDTGSTDNTIAIAQSFGARITQIEWPDDFSAARNVGLGLVRTPWVLILDADEELISDDIPTLQQAITTPIADAYNLRIVSVMDKAEHISESYVLRLFRSHPKVRFEGKVHEQVFRSLGRQQMTINSLNARLLHKGYLDAVIKERDKGKRNRLLLEKHLKESPDDGYMLWQLAQTLMSTGAYKEGIAVCKKALRNIPAENGMWVLAQITYARLLQLNGEPKRAIRALKEGQLAFPTYTDFYYLEGMFLLTLGQWVAAETAFRKCLDLGEAQGYLMTDTGVGGFKSLYHLAQALAKQGRVKESLATLVFLIQRHPAFRDGWQGILTLLAGSTFDAVLDAITVGVPLQTVVSTLDSFKDRGEDEERLLQAAKARLPIPQS